MILILNINKIKRLIKQECANYTTQDNYCCQYDKPCLFFTDNERCKYFEESVLPIDSELERDYWNEHNIVVETKPKPRVTCQKCGCIFEANSNRQKFCDKCRKVNNREKARIRQQKKRNII